MLLFGRVCVWVFLSRKWFGVRVLIRLLVSGSGLFLIWFISRLVIKVD